MSCGTPTGVPPWHSRRTGFERLGNLEDDPVPLGSSTGDGAIRDRPGEALPHPIEGTPVVTMRYLIST